MKNNNNKKKRNVSHLLFLLIAIVPITTWAKPIINEKYEYYTVNPKSAEDLIKALNKASPLRKKNGQVLYGRLNFDMKWNYSWKTNNGQCQMDTVTINLAITFVLPKLKKTDPKIDRVWNKWYPNLIKHENKHRDLAVRMASRIENSFLGMPRKPNCEQLNNQANKIGMRLLDELDSQNVEYDNRTNHGESEGAWLKPL